MCQYDVLNPCHPRHSHPASPISPFSNISTPSISTPFPFACGLRDLTGLPVPTSFATIPPLLNIPVPPFFLPLGISNGLALPPCVDPCKIPRPRCFCPGVASTPCACSCIDTGGAGGGASGSVQKIMRNCSTTSSRTSGCWCRGLVVMCFR